MSGDIKRHQFYSKCTIIKLTIAYFTIAFIIIDGVRNAPAIHPIHVQTIPLHPITSGRIPTERTITPSKPPWYSSSSTPFTDLTSSSRTPPATTHNHSSWWDNQNSVGRIFFRIIVFAFAAFIVSKFLEKVCKSKKKDNIHPVVVKNKMCISTIEGQREEPPPAYAAIHKV